MLTQSEANARLIQLDHDAAIIMQEFDGWVAWPIVKERIWLHSLQGGKSNNAAPKLRDIVLRLLSGLGQLPLNLLYPLRTERAVLYEQRCVTLPDGSKVHPHLGSAVLKNSSWLEYRYVWDQRVAPSPRRGRLEDYGIGAVIAAVAKILRVLPEIHCIAERLAEGICRRFPEFRQSEIRRLIADELARFRLRRNLFAWLLKRSQVRAITVLDSDGKVAEIAAAKQLGLPVTEVQHGMFSAREPDYSWTEFHRQLPWPMPLPDRVVVFGPLWRKELVNAGYWTDDDVISASSPVMGPFRRYRQQRRLETKQDCLTVVFPTQPYVQEAAIKFWHEALFLQQESGERRFVLRIKVHPMEYAQRDAYSALAALYPATCIIIPDSVEAFDELAEADVVAGYTSLMMLESLGLGVPVLGLRGGVVSEGFCETFQLPQLSDLILDCRTAADFWVAVGELTTPGAMERHTNRINLRAREIYEFDAPSIEDILLDQ